MCPDRSVTSQPQQTVEKSGTEEAAQAYYADFYNTAPVGCVSLTRDGSMTHLNPYAARLLGLALAKPVSLEHFGQFVTQADRPLFADVLRRVFAGKTRERCELALVGRDQITRAVQLEAVLSADAQMCRLVLMDVTDRKRVQQELDEEKARVEFVFQASGDGLWDWDMTTDKVNFSRGCKKMIGYSDDELGNEREDWSSHIHPQDLAEVRRVLKQHFEYRTDTYACEYRMICKDGSTKWILARGQVVRRNGLGEPLRMVGTHIDNTQRKLQEERRMLHKLALRDTLVREVHHRIKNNLQGVVGILREFGRTHPQTEAAIAQVVGQVQSVAVIHGLQGKRVHSEVRFCELTAAVAEGIESLWQTPVEVTIPDPWSPCAIASGDAVSIALILNELILNAVKHRDPALGNVQVRLKKAGEPDKVQVEIINGGQWQPKARELQTSEQLGLALVEALLPCEGARLSRTTVDGRICTVLVLGPPVLSLEQRQGSVGWQLR